MPSQDMVRTMIHRRPYRRSLRPSCLLGHFRPFRCGKIKSQFDSLSRSRSPSLSYARSAINGIVRSSVRGTCSSTPSTRVTSAGDALAVAHARGTPWPSATTIHFVPLPRLVFPTSEPLFLREQNFHQQRLHPSRVDLAGRVCRERHATSR